jgi:ribosomal protein S13
VLLALPGVGEVRAASLMKAAGIHETRNVRGLTPRQGNDLAALLTAA